jgi:hypothetical protein
MLFIRSITFFIVLLIGVKSNTNEHRKFYLKKYDDEKTYEFCRAARYKHLFYGDTLFDKDSKYYNFIDPQKIIDPITCEEDEVSYYHVDWFREGVTSKHTKATTRQRGLALAAAVTAGVISGKTINCLSEISGLNVWNTESKGPLHDTLKKLSLSRFESTEYFGPNYQSGQMVDSVQHQDLQSTSFLKESFDLILSTEVFEHIPHPYKAHMEVHRVLKTGGAHVFTVPFVKDYESDIILSVLEKNGTITHTKGIPGKFDPPIYHGDPIRPEGVLAFTYFGYDMIRILCAMGFDVDVQFIQNEKFGVVGQGEMFFIAWKR